MLEFIRKNAQSWGVKLLFGIIVLVFVFWGVGSFRGQQKSVLATVDDQEIPTRTFIDTYQRQLESMRQQNKNLSADQLKQMDFKKQVFNQLIDQTLLLQEARKKGFASSPAEISAQIRSLPSFQDQTSQQFDAARYKALLRMNRMTPAQFEGDMGRDILVQKLLDALASAIQVSEQEARDLFSFVNEQVSIEYILFADQEYTDQVEVTDGEIEAYYQEHRSEFQQPAQMAMDYLLLTPKGLAPYQEVGEQEIRAFYEDNTDQFSRPEQIKARHLLIKLPEDASAEEEKAARQLISQAGQRLEQGEDFAQVATELSQGPSAAQGGDLGWFGRGAMVEPFEEAAFDLESGQTSQPVRTRFGLHLIRVEDRREAGVQPLEQVEDNIRKMMAEDKAAEKLEDTLDTALEIILSTGELQKAAEELGLEPRQSGLFSRQQGIPGIQLDQEALNTLFALKTGEITDRPLFLPEGYLLALKTEETPSRVQALDEVEEEIVTRITRQKARDLALNKAEATLETLQQQDPEGILTQQEIETSQPFNRRGFIPGLGRNPELAQQAFAAEQSGWFDTPYQVASGSILARLGERVPPAEDKWEERKSFWIARLKQNRKQSLYEAYFKHLRDQADIEIHTPDLLTY